MTEKEKYTKWVEKEIKEKGLVDIKLARNLDSEDINEQEFFKELNEINDAIEKGNYKTVAKFDANGIF